MPDPTPSEVSGAVVRLTPQLFDELDQIAKGVGGVVLEVDTPENMPGEFGSFSPMATDVYRDLRDIEAHAMMEISAITIRTEIDPAQWRQARRPEIDWSGFANEDIYRYLVWHEVGHRANNFSQFDVFKPGASTDTRGDLQLMNTLNEVLADRFAWAHMFPKQKMPRRPGAFPQAYWTRLINAFSKRYQISCPTRQFAEEGARYMLPAKFIRRPDLRWVLGDPSDPTTRGGLLAKALSTGDYFIGDDRDGEVRQLSTKRWVTLEAAATALMFNDGQPAGKRIPWCEERVFRREGSGSVRIEFNPRAPFANLRIFEAEQVRRMTPAGRVWAMGRNAFDPTDAEDRENRAKVLRDVGAITLGGNHAA